MSDTLHCPSWAETFSEIRELDLYGYATGDVGYVYEIVLIYIV